MVDTPLLRDNYRAIRASSIKMNETIGVNLLPSDFDMACKIIMLSNGTEFTPINWVKTAMELESQFEQELNAFYSQVEHEEFYYNHSDRL